MTDAVKTGTVTSLYSPDLKVIGIDGTAYKVPGYVEPYAKKVQKGDAVTFKQVGADTILRITRAEQAPAPRVTPPAPAQEQPAPGKVMAPEDFPWNRPTSTPSVREQAQEGVQHNEKQALSVEKAAALAAATKTPDAKAPALPIRPPMLAADLREHRIYWNGLLNTANATIAMTVEPGEPQAVHVREAVMETARVYDRFIREQARAALQGGKA